jgi:hypothetical protein
MDGLDDDEVCDVSRCNDDYDDDEDEYPVCDVDEDDDRGLK